MAKHHYLADCYLKGFAKREDHPAIPSKQVFVIWQYKKSTEELRKSETSKVARRGSYYSLFMRDGKANDRIERFFGKIETQWPSIRKALDNQVYGIHTNQVIRPLTHEQIIGLLDFMFLHRIRSTAVIDSTHEWVVEYIKECAENNRLPQGFSLPNEIRQNTVMSGFVDAYNKDRSAWMLFNAKKRISVCALPARSGTSFLATDTPVIYDGNISSAQVVFPASRRIYIAFHQVHGADRRQVQTVDSLHRDVDVGVISDIDKIEYLNRNIIINAKDEIYTGNPVYLERLLKDMDFPVRCRRNDDNHHAASGA